MSESLDYNYLHFSQGRKQNTSHSNHLLKKIHKLNEEIAILSQQLKFSNKEIEKLNKDIDTLQIENAIKLQSMQEHHEKKLQKSKSDLDFLLKDLNMKSAAILAEHFMKIHAEEIESLKEAYEKKIEELSAKHDSEMSFYSRMKSGHMAGNPRIF